MHEQEDGHDETEQAEDDLDSPGLSEYPDRQEDAGRERQLSVELVEHGDEVGQHENNENRANRKRQHEDDGGVDHRAAQLFDRGVLPLEVGGDLAQHLVESAAVFGRADHVDIELVEDAGVMVNGGGESLTRVEVLADVFERSAERPGSRCALEQLDGIRDRHPNPEEGGKLARE